MNKILDEKYWTERYLTNDFGWDAGDITPPLKAYFDQLHNKDSAILIPGAGNAYEAEYLVNNGFTNVYVCDLSEEPLKNLKKRCPAFKNENLLQADFFELNSDDQSEQPVLSLTKGSRKLAFDLIIEQTFFCALNPALRKRYFQQMATLLKPGGKLAGLLFDDVLNKDQPPFGGNKEEYLSYIGPSFKIKTFDKCYNSIKPRQDRELFINLIRV